MATQPDNYGVGAQSAKATTAGTTGTVNTSTNGTTNSTSTQNTSSNTNSTNMDPKSLAALQALIAQLMGGGTKQQVSDQVARKNEINNVTQQRAGYSKDAAFSDAQGLIAQTMQQALQQLIPSINRAAEGAGTSQSSVRALLLQDAAQKAAQSASVAGLGAATNYGQIATSLSGVLEALTRPNNDVSNALLNALGIAKGAVTNTNTTGNSTTNTVGSTQGNEVKTVAPSGITTGQNNGGAVNTMGYYGPSQTNEQIAMTASQTGTTSASDILRQLQNNAFDNFTF